MYDTGDMDNVMMVVNKIRVVGMLEEVCEGRMEMEEREGIK